MANEPMIPAGMVEWKGGDAAPADWDGGPVRLRSGELHTPDALDPGNDWSHDPRWGSPETDIIAYTSSDPTEPESGAADERGAFDETERGRVVCHSSEDDGIPDVGVSIGLGDGKSLSLGELLRRDDADIGFVLHGPDGQRTVAPIWPDCEWQEVADMLRHHVAPALTRVAADERVRECEAVWRCAIGDVTTALDVLKNRWVGSRLKAEREAGAVLSGVLDLVWAARDPAAGSYLQANANGKVLIERVRAALERTAS